MEPNPAKELEIEHYVFPSYLKEREIPKWTKEDAVRLHNYHIEVGPNARVCVSGSKVACMLFRSISWKVTTVGTYCHSRLFDEFIEDTMDSSSTWSLDLKGSRDVFCIKMT